MEKLEIPGECSRCGKDPADGYATIWKSREKQLKRYCHGDGPGRTCYEKEVMWNLDWIE